MRAVLSLGADVGGGVSGRLAKMGVVGHPPRSGAPGGVAGLVLLLAAVPACAGSKDAADSGVESGEDCPTLTTWYLDHDGDGYGAESIEACDAPEGGLAQGGDCDDGDKAVFPGAEERCDGIDDDCDGEVDEADAVDAGAWYPDGDGDGYGAGEPVAACVAPPDSAAVDGDCDDASDAVHPGSDERCGDLVDDDCDGEVDEDCPECSSWVPRDHPTVQAAIDAASPADVVCVSAGTYEESLDFSGRSLTLLGPEGADATVVDASGLGARVASFAGREPGSVTVSGLTLRGGAADKGGCVYASDAILTLTDLVVEGCTATESSWLAGAGMYLSASDAVVERVIVRDASTEGYGGGVVVDGGAVTLAGVAITGNTVTRYGRVGACSSSTPS